MTTPQPSAATTFASRLTALADARYEELCQTVIDRALAGERWAVELVVRYVFARHDDGQDALRTLLEEIRERTAHGA